VRSYLNPYRYSADAHTLGSKLGGLSSSCPLARDVLPRLAAR
jgi:hypothetical protein